MAASGEREKSIVRRAKKKKVNDATWDKGKWGQSMDWYVLFAFDVRHVETLEQNQPW